LRPWHFQWLAVHYLYRGLRRVLPGLGGRVVDVGCGAQPYRDWFGEVTEYVGLDVVPGPAVDLVVAPGEGWPLTDGHFDILLSSQVLEHVEHLERTLSEMDRVLKPGGVAILSFPFLFNEHGAPHDYRRFTAHQAARLLPGYRVLTLERQGGVGSTSAILFLNWVDDSLNRHFATRLLKAPLLPLWILLSGLANLSGWLGDHLDRTGGFYSNVLLVARKQAGAGTPASPSSTTFCCGNLPGYSRMSP
jgi:SAM-dependent methyltransferase